MVDFKYFINNDWFKCGRFGEKHVKYINISALTIATIFFISFLFYLILYSFTNFHALDNLIDYMKTYDTEENSEFERINLGMKIMPSYNREKNVLYMEHSNDIYKTKIPKALSLMESFVMNNTFFFINQTANFFPTLSYKEENLPVGNSITMCLSVSWASKERGKNYDIMKTVKGFPRCKETESDPIYGIDVPVWIQKSFEIDCTDDQACSNYCKSYNSIFVKGRNKKKCYSYDILDTICFVIDYDPLTNEHIYAGGCFKDNSVYLMTPAKTNQIYYFDGIEIEVRNKKDPIILAGELSNFSYSFGASWKWLAMILNTLLLFSLMGILIIAYFIYYYKKKYNTGALLSEKPKPESNLESVPEQQA